MDSSKHLVLIGLGSNLGSPVEQISLAIDAIGKMESTCICEKSSFYQSIPQGPQDQDDFVNAVVLIQTSLTPSSLLGALQSIEKQQGKVKVRHWGERIIDLDILFYAQESIQLITPDLVIPHPYALTRDFVVIPSLEVAPEWQLPNGKYLKEYLVQCDQHQLQLI